MRQTILSIVLLVLVSGGLSTTSCSKQNSTPTANLVVQPTIGAPGTTFTIDASGSSDTETETTQLQVRLDWESDGIWDVDWTTQKVQTFQPTVEGDYLVKLEVKDVEGQVQTVTTTLKVTNSNQLIPATSPFHYNIGINYETWPMGRGTMNITHDLDTITKYFRLLKTFHCEGVGTSNIVMDNTQQQVIDYILAHEDKSIELAMGTSNAVLASGGFGTPWVAGLMTTKSYTDQWVAMVISSFKSVANVKKHVRIILLGNEIDANGPPSSDSHFSNYYNTWIPQAFSNLKASLSDAGLGSIPVSTIIANYPLGDPNSNVVASTITSYVKANWNSSWNSGNPFLLFNQYTPNNGVSTDFGSVINYFESVHTKLSESPNLYVGETGYSEENSLANEVSVISAMFTWLDSQHKINGRTVPLFAFMAFDHPEKGAGQKKMGLFRDDASNQPLGLKANIKVPAWVATPNL